MNIARTTLSSKVLTNEKEHFARLAVDAVLRLDGSTNLDSIFIIKKSGGSLRDSFLGLCFAYLSLSLHRVRLICEFAVQMMGLSSTRSSVWDNPSALRM